ncbi:MAG: hypothetical protein ABIU97_01640 [Dehalococcoidia bacterium]
MALTIVGAALGFAGVEVHMNSSMRLVTFAIFLGMPIWQLIIMRALILPSMVKQGTPRKNVEIAGYGMAGSAGVFAVGAAVVTGTGWAALPVGLVGLFNWLTVRAFLESLPYEPPATVPYDA